MPKYYFHISNGHPFKDGEGLELPDRAAAWREAKRTTVDDLEDMAPHGEWKLTVVEGDQEVYRIQVVAKTVA